MGILSLRLNPKVIFCGIDQRMVEVLLIITFSLGQLTVDIFSNSLSSRVTIDGSQIYYTDGNDITPTETDDPSTDRPLFGRKPSYAHISLVVHAIALVWQLVCLQNGGNNDEKQHYFQ